MTEKVATLQPDIKNFLSNEQAWYYAAVPLKTEGDVLHLLINEEKNTSSWQSELEIVL